jgi:hypothetical protein
MPLKKNKIIPLHSDLVTILHYLHPTRRMRLKRSIRLQLNPYSTYRQTHRINKATRYVYKKVDKYLRV